MEFLAQLHPLIVHFPIVFFMSYILMEGIGIARKNSLTGYIALVLLGAGLITGFFSMLTGNQAVLFAEQWGKTGLVDIRLIPMDVIQQHEQWATITLFWFLSILVGRVYLSIQVDVKKNYTMLVYKAKLVFLLLGIVGYFFVYRTGEYGGKLVYEHGVGTQMLLKTGQK